MLGVAREGHTRHHTPGGLYATLLAAAHHRSCFVGWVASRPAVAVSVTPQPSIGGRRPRRRTARHQYRQP